MRTESGAACVEHERPSGVDFESLVTCVEQQRLVNVGMTTVIDREEVQGDSPGAKPIGADPSADISDSSIEFSIPNGIFIF